MPIDPADVSGHLRVEQGSLYPALPPGSSRVITAEWGLSDNNRKPVITN